MSDRQSYDEGNNTIVKQSSSVLYSNAGDEALHKLIDLHYDGFEWQYINSWINKTNQTNTYVQTYTSQLSITQGKDAENHWSFGADFKDLSVGIGSSTKKFTPEETTTSKAYTVTVNVGPNSSVYFYQKKYKFKPVVWFRLDAWAKFWAVGNWKSGGVCALNGYVEIDSNEYLTTDSVLSGSGFASAQAASGIVLQDNIKQFQDCPKKCRNYLYDRGC
jgi:hypothetical protein